MQSHSIYATSAPVSRRPTLPVVALLIGGSFVQAAIASYWLWEQQLSPAPFRAPAALVFVLLAGAQSALGWRIWRSQKKAVTLGKARRRLFYRWLSVGLVVCYGGSLLAVDPASGLYVFSAALAAWYFAVLLAVLSTPLQLDRLLSLLRQRWLRTIGWTGYALLMMPLGTELGLRTYAYFFAGPAGASYLAVQAKLHPGTTFGDRQVNAQGYWDDEFHAEHRPGTLRVAALGGRIGLGENSREHFLSLIETASPEVELYNFALPQAELSSYAVQVQQEIAPYRPQLVLAFISVGQDLPPETEPGLFDWRSAHTLRLGAGWLLTARTGNFLAGSLPMMAPTTQEDAYQAHLQESLSQLVVCRTPLDARMQKRWATVFANLERLIETCRAQELPLALVVTPSEFQVNAVLRDVLRRRAGYAAEELDVDLPQRRLAAFARQHQVPVVDLLPHLQLQPSDAFARYEPYFGSSGNVVAADVVGHFVRSYLNTSIAGEP